MRTAYELIADAVDLAGTYAEDGAPASARANLLRARALIDSALAHPAAGTPDFFLPGRTYANGDGFTAPEETTLFRAELITTHPVHKTLRAIGWQRTATSGSPWREASFDGAEFAEMRLLPEPDECTCVITCAEDPASACALSGQRHVHPDPSGLGTFGPCPEHPDAPGDL
ncbi:hypothetical protein OG612_45605 (plasmid) [Streptomyces sp. NBC_01527]|uniref:hypothetical protein n=1 Tax=Streptomyces sp. NBC_01527 TaxID=2903894 RepID=UPI002F91BC19